MRIDDVEVEVLQASGLSDGLGFADCGLGAPVVQMTLCDCGVWYRWDEVHMDLTIVPNGGCLRTLLRAD